MQIGYIFTGGVGGGGATAHAPLGATQDVAEDKDHLHDQNDNNNAAHQNAPFGYFAGDAHAVDVVIAQGFAGG